MNPTSNISQMISTIALALVLVSSPTVTEAVSPLSFPAQSKGNGGQHTRQADFGLLGNAIKFVVDNYFSKQAQATPETGSFFEQPDTDIDDTGSDIAPIPSATPEVAAPRPGRGRQADFGLLGNAIKRVVDAYSDSPKTSTVKAAAATTSQAVPMAEDSWAQKRMEKRQQRREQRDYGLLGNVVARLVSEFSGTSEGASEGAVHPATAPVSGSPLRPHTAKVATVPESAPAPLAPKVGSVPNPVEGLKAVKDLVQLLGSSFLEDPSFRRAAEALKQLDARTSIDSPAGEGGFITAAERERLLSFAEAVGCTVCSGGAARSSEL